MAKIPFTLEAWLKDKSQKVETKSGFPAKILHCDGYGESPMLVTVDIGDGCGMQTRLYFADGKLYKGKSDADLFIVTPEPELNEFEQAVKDLCWKVGIIGEVFYKDDIIKKTAAELLDLARTELTCQGNIVLSIEEFEKCFIEAQEKGRNEALNDLPRWEKTSNKGTYVDASNIFYHDGYYLGIKTLEKLPGFKEDEI